MKRKSHVATAPQTAASDFLPNSIAKQEFGRRVFKLMIAKGWNQSDLARAVYGKGPDGYALGRDSISTYIRGRSFPEPVNLTKLAKALGVTEDQLLPNAAESAIDNEIPAFELRAAAGHPDRAWVRLNRMMSFTTAAKIAELLVQEDKAAK